MYTKTADGSFIDESGKVIYFSIPRFISDIVNGESCFICGREPSEVEFNNEHVLPDWILGKYNLYNRLIVLPNLHGYTYRKYTIPCCVNCNRQMGKEIETPISEITKKGYAAVSDYLRKNGPRLFFVWFSLIFLKTHLKDRGLRVSLDRRKDEGEITDFYQWEELHHIHCIARSFYTGAIIHPAVYGTFITLQAKDFPDIESFDYGDLYDSRGVLLRIEDTCFLVILNDSQACGYAYHKHLLKLDGPLTPLQLREVFARVSYPNHLLVNRPVYRSALDINVHEYRIEAELPSRVELSETKPEELGLVIYSCVRPILEKLKVPNRDAVEQGVKAGALTFLFDDSGAFIVDSMRQSSDIS